jgi:hypothetical protein
MPRRRGRCQPGAHVGGTQLISNYQAAQAYQQVNNAYVGYWYNGSAWVNQ